MPKILGANIQYLMPQDLFALAINYKVMCILLLVKVSILRALKAFPCRDEVFCISHFNGMFMESMLMMAIVCPVFWHSVPVQELTCTLPN